MVCAESRVQLKQPVLAIAMVCKGKHLQNISNIKFISATKISSCTWN